MYATLANLPKIFSKFTSQYGDTITVFRDSGNLTTYGVSVKGRKLLSPFEINFLRFMMFAADSPIVRGDHIKNESTNEEYFVTATTVETAVSATMNVYTEMYMINYPSIEVQRNMPPQYDQYGNPIAGTGGWSTVATVPMNVEHVNGNIPYKDGLLLADTTYKLTCQAAADILLKPTPDRIVIDGNPLMISDINLTIAPGLQIVQIKTDTRS